MEKELHFYTFSTFRMPSIHLETALEQNPAHIESWLHKGIALTNLDLHEEAITAFDHALALNPKLTEATVRKSIDLIRLRQYEEAVTILSSSVEEQPRDLWAWCYLGIGFIGP